MWRRSITVLLIAAVVASVTAAIAARRRPSGNMRPKHASILTLDGPRTTDGDEFHSIYNTGLEATTWVGKLITASGPMVVTFSGTFEGGPVDVRVSNNGKILYPSLASFDPSDGTKSFSFTFAGRGSRDADCHYIDPEWRSPTGAEVTLLDMVVTITYRRDFKRDGRAIACPA